jgi:lipid II:glycine glycyltransferase (peptidoglycan interpeptide bridge formation enzyme)
MQPYFLQQTGWINFWQKANGVGHQPHFFSIENDQYKLSAIICEYPWHLGQNFWYIAKGGVLENLESKEVNNWSEIEKDSLEKLFWELNAKIVASAKTQKITYIKSDWEEGLTQKLGLESVQDLHHFYQKNYPKALVSNKIIQYLSTITLDLSQISDLITPQNVNDINALKTFFVDSKSFWKTTNSNVNRYTKKSLDLNWQVSNLKTDENFEAFWQVYNQTKERQHFAIQSKEYTRLLFDQDFSRLIILRDAQGQPQCVWFGIVFGDTMTYLYGGNTDYSFENYGQYLMHLIAVAMASSEKIINYDLGGYDPTKGFGKFKENYKGKVRNFLGVIDLPIDGLKYSLTNHIISLAKVIKKSNH